MVDNLSQQFVNNNTKFSFKLFAEIMKESDKQNIFVSPLSIATALMMVCNGATGATQQAIMKPLNMQSPSMEEINNTFTKLKDQFSERGDKIPKSLGDGWQLVLANSIWGNQSVEFQPEFVTTMKNIYSAEIASLDFSNPESTKHVNKWVNDVTGGNIPQIIDFDPRTLIVILNAVYFKAFWLRPFGTQNTKKDRFRLLNGKHKLCDMMRVQTHFKHWKTDNCEVISLPYIEKSSFLMEDSPLSLYIFLPHKRFNLKTFATELFAEQAFQLWESTARSSHGELVLPKFQFAYDIELKSIFEALGMGVIFSGDADFSRLCRLPNAASVSRITHKTRIEVNEAGTEAAAATSVSYKYGRAPRVTFRMRVDRPFFCVIRDSRTETILFIGAVVEPM